MTRGFPALAEGARQERFCAGSSFRGKRRAGRGARGHGAAGAAGGGPGAAGPGDTGALPAGHLPAGTGAPSGTRRSGWGSTATQGKAGGVQGPLLSGHNWGRPPPGFGFVCSRKCALIY